MSEITIDRIRSWSRLTCAVATLITLFFSFNLYQSIPKFEQMFKEMDLGSLPLLTTIVLTIRFDILLPMIAVFGIAKEILIKDPVRSLNLSFVQVAAVFVLREVYAQAMFQPLITIMEKIGR